VRELGIGALVVMLLACDRPPADRSERSSPSTSAPAQASAKPDVCRGGGGKVDDALGANTLPRAVGGLCIDPHADFRSYGVGAKAPLRAACEVLGGDCAGYARFGLRRVLVVPYVNGVDPRARITVTLLELESPEASYALFTERVLGDSPDAFAEWKSVDASGTALVSGASALAWRASHLGLLDYADETSAPGRAAERGAPALAALARELVRSLPGKPELPRSAALLPKRDGGPLATRFEHQDLFGIAGLGAGAVARYVPGGRATPLAVLVRLDDDAAKDVIRTLRRIPGSRSVKGAPYEAVGVSIKEGEAARRMEWLFGRKRNVVLGVGREPERLGRAAAAAVRHRELLRLNALLDDLRL
jgi:hypothetical protein